MGSNCRTDFLTIFLQYNRDLGCMHDFFNDFGSKSACGGGKASGKGKPSQNPTELVNFSNFLAKNDSIGTLVACTDFKRFWSRNRIKNVIKS
jgi:hypothetical protein